MEGKVSWILAGRSGRDSVSAGAWLKRIHSLSSGRRRVVQQLVDGGRAKFLKHKLVQADGMQM